MMRARLRAHTLLSPVPSQSHQRGKPATRRTLLSRRDTIPSGEHARASACAADAAAVIFAARLAPDATIALYAAKGSELDAARIDAWARGAGIAIAYPRVVADQRLLAFHLAAPDDLVATRLGLREPRADAPIVELADIDAFVVPGLAFDRGGGRIGWGRGHYDATLAAAPHALALALAFELQLVEHVPREPHDRLVDVIVTERATYWIAS